ACWLPSAATASACPKAPSPAAPSRNTRSVTTASWCATSARSPKPPTTASAASLGWRRRPASSTSSGLRDESIDAFRRGNRRVAPSGPALRRSALQRQRQFPRLVERHRGGAGGDGVADGVDLEAGARQLLGEPVIRRVGGGEDEAVEFALLRLAGVEIHQPGRRALPFRECGGQQHLDAELRKALAQRIAGHA